jgi:hypothetical protein
MNDPATDELRGHLSRVIAILQYALSSGTINNTTAIRLAAVYLSWADRPLENR